MPLQVVARHIATIFMNIIYGVTKKQYPLWLFLRFVVIYLTKKVGNIPFFTKSLTLILHKLFYLEEEGLWLI